MSPKDDPNADRPALVEFALKYAASDLLCYRADGPAGLRDRQRQTWQPLLDWAAESLDAPLEVTEGVVPVKQPRQSLEHLKAAVEELNDDALKALSLATRASGSLIVGLALVKGRINAGEALKASLIDETWQREKWGDDDPDANARLEALEGDFREAAELLP